MFQLVVSTIQQAGRAASDIDPQSQNWRFLLFNHKFGEYCDTNSRDKRAVCDGDKFQLVFVPKKLSQLPQNGWISASQPATSRNRATAEIQNQTPLIFLDEEDEDVKPVGFFERVLRKFFWSYKKKGDKQSSDKFIKK